MSVTLKVTLDLHAAQLSVPVERELEATQRGERTCPAKLAGAHSHVRTNVVQRLYSRRVI